MKLLVWTAAIVGLMANASFAAALDSQTHNKNKFTTHANGTMVNHPKPGSTVMFNPQPDPPVDKNGTGTTVNHATPGSNVMFNPQPDPPGDTPTATGGGGGPG